MKITFLVVLFFVVALTGALLNHGKEKERRMKMAFYSYQTGCYDSAKIACGHTYTDDDRYNCYEHALAYCPANAKTFTDWVSHGSKN